LPKFAADENFNNAILRGLIRRNPDIDIVRIQDVGLSGAHDSEVLEWCASEGRILLTHDVSTITHYAYGRIRAKKAMTGVFEVGKDVFSGAAIDDILLIAECSVDGEWEGQVRYLPLR
jgi:hypothetical protein